MSESEETAWRSLFAIIELAFEFQLNSLRFENVFLSKMFFEVIFEQTRYFYAVSRNLPYFMEKAKEEENLSFHS
jgi:hypothetical protein